MNPFFEPLSETGITNFAAIKFEHYREAFDRGYAEHNGEIAAIVSNPASSTSLTRLKLWREAVNSFAALLLSFSI